MKVCGASTLVALLAGLGCGGVGAGAEGAESREPVSAPPRGRPDAVMWEERFDRMPADWHAMSGASDRELARVFSIGREAAGGFLQARHHGFGADPPPAIHFGRSWSRRPLRLRDACLLSWRWRVLRHPAVEGNPWRDVAASIYVITDPPGLLSRGRGFKLGWLSRPGPLGTHQRGLLQLALRVDPASDRWQSEEVDLCELFRRHFGPVDDEPLGYVGVVSDADDSASAAEADYDDMVLRTGSLRSISE